MRSLLISLLLVSALLLSSCRSAESVSSVQASLNAPALTDSLFSLRWAEAQAHLDAHQYRKAEKALTEVIRLSPTPQAYCDRAFCRLQRKQYAQAHSDLRIAMADSLCDAETYHYAHHLLPKLQALQERKQRRYARVGRFLFQTLFFFTQLWFEHKMEEWERRDSSPAFLPSPPSSSGNAVIESPVTGSNERRPSRGGAFK